MINKLGACLLVVGLTAARMESQAQVLQGYWEQAKSNYIGFSIRQQEVGLAQLDSQASFDKYKPQVWLQYQQGLSSLNNATGAFYPMAGIFNINAPNNLHGDGSTFNQYASSAINWDLVHFGRKKLDKSLGISKVNEAVLQSSQYELLIQRELTRRYIDFLYHQILHDWYDAHLKRYDDILGLTRELSNGGIVPIADTLLVSAALKNIQAELLHVDGQVKGAAFALSEFVGDNVDTASHRKTHFFKPIVDLEGITKPQPLLEVKKNKVLQLETAYKQSSKDILPRVMAIGALSLRSSGVSSEGVVSNNYTDLYKNYAPNYFVGVGVSWNLQQLFTGQSLKRSLDVQRNKAKLEYEQLDDEFRKRMLDLDVQQRMSRSGLSQSDNSRQEAQEAFEMYRARFEGGLINLAELLQVQSVLLQHEKQNLNHYHQYWNVVLERSFLKADLTEIIQHF